MALLAQGLLVGVVLADEIDVGVPLAALADLGQSSSAVKPASRSAGVVADAAAALQHRLLAGHRPPLRSSPAGQDVQQPGVGVGEVELADGVDELAPALGDDQLAAQQVLRQAGGLQEASGDGEDRPSPP